jgi:transposase InsO family protein
MIWFIVMHLFSTLLDWVRIGQLTEQEKDLEILLLRQQLGIAQRKLHKPVRSSRVERLTVAVVTTKLRSVTGRTTVQLHRVIRIFQPETVLRWHRQLVRRKWTHNPDGRRGRPKVDSELERLVVRLARDNLDWGYGKIRGELKKLGYTIAPGTIARILKRQNIPPTPERGTSPSWRHLMRHYKDQILREPSGRDFFTVETIFLKTIYVLFFIELGSRRVHFAGCTTNPDGSWVTQQARQLVWDLEDREPRLHFLIHDRDSKFTDAFDTVFRSEGVKIILTPARAQNAISHAERWVRSVRTECLDKLLIVNQSQLRSVMSEYVDYYNTARPHQGIDLQTPICQTMQSREGSIQCRNVLGGIIHDYYRKAA